MIEKHNYGRHDVLWYTGAEMNFISGLSAIYYPKTLMGVSQKLYISLYSLLYNGLKSRENDSESPFTYGLKIRVSAARFRPCPHSLIHPISHVGIRTRLDHTVRRGGPG